MVDVREIIGSVQSGSLKTFRWGCPIGDRMGSRPSKRNENMVVHSV